MEEETVGGRLAAAPRCPVAPHLALPNRVLVGGSCGALSPLRPRNEALLRYDFAVRSESKG